SNSSCRASCSTSASRSSASSSTIRILRVFVIHAACIGAGAPAAGAETKQLTRSTAFGAKRASWTWLLYELAAGAVGAGKVMRRLSFSVIRVRRVAAGGSRGLLLAGSLAIPVVLGRSSVRANKREGDGATPRGRFGLVRLWWRADRLPRPRTALPARRIEPALA